ncbi:hypothetical protein [Paracraurococcus lichenis]|uniref:PepSY domain-containing protein n=1 Tax=Paracraurococcus lichenis TaxID=3064888 RepID=A0ABT9E1E7_9PROT|nr:hypothetical protein [Paracraurococcus sp. LOR1-02]MDO9709966.1 hypothetical protein [Paracraurococcus sp. LOR1-02]
MIAATLAAAVLAAPAALAQQQDQGASARHGQVQPSPEAKEHLGQEIRLSEVPPMVLQAAQRELGAPVTRAEKMTIYTRPVYELAGKNASGQEVKVKVNDDGTILPSGTERR